MVDLLVLALFSNEHLLFLGPPGTAKTTVAKKVSGLVEDDCFFYHLMTRFTTPDEIFGPVSLKDLREGDLVRNTDRYLPSAKLALLDEIFKSSSIILNSILDLLN
jgi:MoxR-like ATPase